MTRKLNFGPAPTGIEARLQWIERALREIERQSADINSFSILDSFVPENVTLTRTFDANSTTLDEVADVVGTIITDHKNRGQKRA